MSCQRCASHLHRPLTSVRDYFDKNTNDQLGEALHRRIDPFPPVPLFLRDNPFNNNKKHGDFRLHSKNKNIFAYV